MTNPKTHSSSHEDRKSERPIGEDSLTDSDNEFLAELNEFPEIRQKLGIHDDEN